MNTLLHIEGLSKTFGHVRALRNAEVTLTSGETRALAGANGSGKSTLIKVLSGYYSPDEPVEMKIGAFTVTHPMRSSVRHSLGVHCVHQDLGLIQELTVLDNLVMGDTARQRWPALNVRRMRRQAKEVLSNVELDVSLDRPVETLTRTDRALLALARAYSSLQRHRQESGRNGILILDEITAFLPRKEVPVLQRVMRDVSDAGHAVIFVSHDLDEVMETADTVTVLRDGSIVDTLPVGEVDHDRLVHLMTGRERSSVASVAGLKRESRDVVVEVTKLAGPGVRDVTFSVQEGEIVGLTGVLGSGFDMVPYLMFGASDSATGAMKLPGGSIEISELQPARAFTAGIGLVPGERRTHGLYMDLPIYENLACLRLPDFTGRDGLLRWARARRMASETVEELGVVTAGVQAPPQALSGGNQQKVLIGRWLDEVKQLMLLHEPVQGVDVGAREAIVRILRAKANAGLPMICASSDYELLVALCDRVLVMHDGAIRYELTSTAPGGRLDKERLIEMTLGYDERRPA